MKTIRNNLGLSIFLGVFLLIIFTWVYAYIYQVNTPPQGYQPGTKVYILTEKAVFKDGQMCRESFPMYVASFDASGGKWWQSLGGLGYSVSVVFDGGGQIYNQAIQKLLLVQPDTCADFAPK